MEDAIEIMQSLPLAQLKGFTKIIQSVMAPVSILYHMS